MACAWLSVAPAASASAAGEVEKQHAQGEMLREPSSDPSCCFMNQTRSSPQGRREEALLLHAPLGGGSRGTPSGLESNQAGDSPRRAERAWCFSASLSLCSLQPRRKLPVLSFFLSRHHCVVFPLKLPGMISLTLPSLHLPVAERREGRIGA